MPRFHFNSYNGHATEDIKGSEHSSIFDARIHAMRHYAELLCERAAAGEGCEDLKLEVTDGAGLILFSMSMSLVDAPAAWGQSR